MTELQEHHQYQMANDFIYRSLFESLHTTISIFNGHNDRNTPTEVWARLYMEHIARVISFNVSMAFTQLGVEKLFEHIFLENEMMRQFFMTLHTNFFTRLFTRYNESGTLQETIIHAIKQSVNYIDNRSLCQKTDGFNEINSRLKMIDIETCFETDPWLITLYFVLIYTRPNDFVPAPKSNTSYATKF